MEIFYSPTGNYANKYSVLHASAGIFSYVWTIPADDTITAKIFIEGHALDETIIAGDESDNYFSVKQSCAAGDYTPPVSLEKFTRSLTVGSTGDDVSAQALLIGEGVYPEALVTGYFGSLTRAAVIRFQDKYKDEILTPVGLTKGTGFFGPSTRTKANALLGTVDVPQITTTMGFKTSSSPTGATASVFVAKATGHFKTFHISQAWRTPTQLIGLWAAHGGTTTVMDT